MCEHMIKWLSCAGLIFASALSISCYATAQTEQRIDNIPMYGQPRIPRPDYLRRADDDFIREASNGFGGNREAASKAWAAQAEALLSKGNIDFAMRRYNQAWLLHPDNYKVYWGFGRVMLERDKLDESIEHLEKAKQLVDDPYQKVALLSDAGSAYSYKADSFPLEQGQERARYFTLANQNFRESTTLDPTYPNSWRRWAMSLYLEGQYSEAWEKVIKAQSMNAPPFPHAFLRKLEQKMPKPE